MDRRIDQPRYRQVVHSPLGGLAILANDDAIVAVKFGAQQHADDRPNQLTRFGGQQLAEYFDGRRHVFDVPVAGPGTTFQRRVWRALCEIPFGTSCSYQQLARAIGQPTAARAVGSANGANPIPIIVPCHRVIGAAGQLVGFGGGLQRKRWLLEHEGTLRPVQDEARCPAER